MNDVLETEQTATAPQLTGEDLEEIVRLVTEVCHESGHGQVTIKVRDGIPALFEKFVMVEPPSRRAQAVNVA